MDEDSDSLDEFEIGIQNAQSKNQRGPGKKKMSSFMSDNKRAPPAKTFSPSKTAGQGLNDDSSEEDEEAQPVESEINFSDNPTLKDFLNLSNGGARFIKAT